MFKPSKKQISAFIGGSALIGIVGLLVYAAVFFAPSQQPIGYVAQPTMSNYSVATGTANVYRGEFNNADWSGRFDCYPVGTNGYVNLYAPCFTSGASSPLDIQAASGTRNIGTRSDSSTAPGVEFSTTGLTTAQSGVLGGVGNINWIRGTSLSPTGLRARTTVLGDIIHSRPYYYTDGTNPTVFVGANDGMLHAFNATNGQERWAYVPSMLISSTKMAMLPATGYTHDYFVDGSMAIAKIGSSSTAKTVLVGALGAGGIGLYGLDISTLTATSGLTAGQKGLWEITNSTLVGTSTRAASTAYTNLGYTYSNPVVVPTQDGSDSVIVGNGYNNTGNGHATLYVINAQNGSLIREIDTGSGSTTSPNGLSSPTVIDSNGDNKADRVYAGDIDGNMWVFDLSSSSSASWSVTKLYATGQAITQAPTVSVHPNGGFMVNFGTGRILSGAGATAISPSTTGAADDTTDTTQYYAYGLWDNKSGTTITSGQMISQTIAPSTYIPSLGAPAASSVIVRNITTNVTPNWAIVSGAPVNRGWMDQLPVGGDRVVGDGDYVDNGKFQFNVTNPTVSYTPSGSTSTARGLNWMFSLDYLTGGAGTLPFLDLNSDGVINNYDLLKDSSGNPITGASGIPIAYGSSNGVQSQPILIQLSQVRIPLYNQSFNVTTTPATNGTGVNGGHFDVDILYNTNVQCINGTVSSDATACVTGTCTGGTLNPSGNACTTIPASCSSGALNSGLTACVAVPASCAGGTLNTGSTACAVKGTFSSPPAKCTGGTLNTAKTACTAPGTYTAASPAGTFTAATTPGTFTPLASPGVYLPPSGTGAGGFQKVTHVHEYDKVYDVNGLNPLNPNDITYRLSDPVPAGVAYKVLLMNQGWNRAMILRIGTNTGTWTGNVRDYQTMLPLDIVTNYITATCSAANTTNKGIGCLDVANLPSFRGDTSNVGHLTSTTNTLTTTGTLSSTSGTDYTVAVSSVSNVSGKINVVNVNTTGTISCESATGTLPTGCTASSSPWGARSSIGGLELSMPNDGFNLKDWWSPYGDGTVQTGVMPTQPACAYNVNTDGTMPANGSGAGKQYTGPNGERHDGVITLQIINALTPNSDVQMNVPGQPIYGFRVIDAKITADVLAEYTLYWHHPNSTCMGDSGTTWPTTFTGSSTTSADPWWPDQETVPSNFVPSKTNSTSKYIGGGITCYTKLNQATNGPPTWKTTAYNAANTSPYHTPAGSSASGPAGWTIAPLPDSSTTLPVCPTYNALYDDPRGASFIDATTGANSTPGTTGIGGLINLLGGSQQGSAAGTGAGGSTSASGVAPTSSVLNTTTPQTGTPGVARRITWRELIGL